MGLFVAYSRSAERGTMDSGFLDFGEKKNGGGLAFDERLGVT